MRRTAPSSMDTPTKKSTWSDFLSNNIISWWTPDIFIEAEYHAMTNIICKLVWLRYLPLKLRITYHSRCNSPVTVKQPYTWWPARCFMSGLDISSWTIILKEITKWYHHFISSQHHLIDIFTKVPSKAKFHMVMYKLGVFPLYIYQLEEY